MQSPRLSRMKAVVEGSLKGLSAKDFYRAQAKISKNYVLACARYLPNNVWIKLDRHKPVTQKQKTMICRAMNKSAMEDIADFPYSTPIVKMKTIPVPGSKKLVFYTLKEVEFRRMKPIPRASGTAYLVNHTQITHKGLSGYVAYTSHAIDRLLERVPALLVVAKERYSPIVLDVLQRSVANADVKDDGSGAMLDALGMGLFPLEYDDEHKLWICTTFLMPDMHGTPQKRMETLMEQLKAKYA